MVGQFEGLIHTSRIAMDGTTTINLLQPYLLFSSNMVLMYVYVLPTPVSISIVRLYLPTSRFDGSI